MAQYLIFRLFTVYHRGMSGRAGALFGKAHDAVPTFPIETCLLVRHAYSDVYYYYTKVVSFVLSEIVLAGFSRYRAYIVIHSK